MQRANFLTGNNIYALRQGGELIARLDDGLYTGVKRPFFNYSAGTHFRHCLDSYNCFFAGLEAGEIDYDVRERNELIERNRAIALEQIERIINRLESFSAADSGTRLRVKMECAAPLDPDSWGDSSVLREMNFLMSHTIHHYAIIAMMLRIQGFEPGEQFGVAPSTLEHWKEVSQCAR